MEGDWTLVGIEVQRSETSIMKLIHLKHIACLQTQLSDLHHVVAK